MRATSGRAGREMMAATFFTEDEDDLAMLNERMPDECMPDKRMPDKCMSNKRKKDCTEFEAKTTKGAGQRSH
jgi:hypothetical protein